MSENIQKVETTAVNPHSAKISQNAKGDYALEVKSYGESVLLAVSSASEGLQKLQEEVASIQAK